MATCYAAYYNIVSSQKEAEKAASRRSSASATPAKSQDKKLTMSSALKALTPTEEQIIPSGIYTPIIKRGSLFSSFRRSSKDISPSSSRKHSATQRSVDAALMR